MTTCILLEVLFYMYIVCGCELTVVFIKETKQLHMYQVQLKI